MSKLQLITIAPPTAASRPQSVSLWEWISSKLNNLLPTRSPVVKLLLSASTIFQSVGAGQDATVLRVGRCRFGDVFIRYQSVCYKRRDFIFLSSPLENCL